MKKFAIIGALLVTLTSCDKEGDCDWFDKEDECETVAQENVPTEVRASFEAKYSGSPVETWFNVDDKGFTALFTKDGIKNLAAFDNAGNFLKCETEDEYDENEDEHEDECECEVED